MIDNKPDESRLPIISYEQIDYALASYNPAIREHDGKSFAIEIANMQRYLDSKTASIKDQEWEGKEKEYLEAIEDARWCGYYSGKAEGEQARQEIVKWGEGRCYKHLDGYGRRFECRKCIKELKRGVE